PRIAPTNRTTPPPLEGGGACALGRGLAARALVGVAWLVGAGLDGLGVELAAVAAFFARGEGGAEFFGLGGVACGWDGFPAEVLADVEGAVGFFEGVCDAHAGVPGEGPMRAASLGGMNSPCIWR